MNTFFDECIHLVKNEKKSAISDERKEDNYNNKKISNYQIQVLNV